MRRDSDTTEHWFGPRGKSSKGKGHPIMYGAPKVAHHFGDFPDGGGYPKGFLEWAFSEMGCDDERVVLHLCSGSVLSGIRVDVRPEMNPDVVADCRQTPFPDESFDFILADPPYSSDYARNLYDTENAYPKPGQICAEAARLLRPGGKFGLMHFQVPMFRKPLKLLGVYGIQSGAWFQHSRVDPHGEGCRMSGLLRESLVEIIREEGDRRRSKEWSEDGPNYGEDGEGLSRDERDQWYEAASFVDGLDWLD